MLPSNPQPCKRFAAQTGRAAPGRIFAPTALVGAVLEGIGDTNISGASANPDGEEFLNLLEYAMGLDPKTPDLASTLSATLSNSLFTLSFSHYKPATDKPIAGSVVRLMNWSSVTTTQSLDLGLTETLTYQEAAFAPARCFRLRCWQQ